MSGIPNGVYKLNLDLSRALQVLKLAGWYENRCVDITEREIHYSKFGYSLTEYHKALISEFYGLPTSWKFRWEDNKHKIHIGGYDYTFDLDDDFDDSYDKDNLPFEIQPFAVPLIEAGYHQFPGTVWSGKDKPLIRTSELNNKTETFNSVTELLEFDLNSAIPANEHIKSIFVTFGPQSLLHWDE
jgi:hypothetical protein